MKIAAEILVKCGYADEIIDSFDELRLMIRGKDETAMDVMTKILPFADTIEGRRQADAIEDWLIANKFNSLWIKSEMEAYPHTTGHQWRLDRIKWCLEQMKPLEGGDRDEQMQKM